MVEILLVVALVALIAPSALAAEQSALLYSSSDLPFNEVLSKHLETSGYSVTRAGSDDVREAIGKQPELLVLSSARRFPAEALEALVGYLEQGGRLLAVGAPAFEELLVKREGRWVTVAEARSELARLKPDRLLFDLAPGDERKWTRSTNHPDTEERLRVFQGAMSSFVSEVDGWNVYDSPKLDKPFEDGQTVTVLEARGDGRTARLRVEWREADGSRWIARLPLSEVFRTYRLSPTDFRYWPDNPSSGRGGPGDGFRPANAVQLSIGLADDEDKVGRGQHLWWVRNIGTSADELAVVRGGPPAIECLSPSYKTYPMREVVRIGARADQAFVNKSFRMDLGGAGAMPVWRPRGAASGPGEGSDYRFIPLVDAFDGESNWRGSAAWAVACFRGSKAGARWAGIGLEPALIEPDASEQISKLAVKLVGVLRAPALIEHAGVQEFKCVPDTGFEAQGAVWTSGRGETKLRIEASVWQKGKQFPLGIAELADADRAKLANWSLPERGLTLEPGPAHLTTTLFAGEEQLDEVTQALSIEPGDIPLAKPGVSGDCFTIDGSPVYLNGVNYMPRYVLAHEDERYTLGWLEWWQYDPEMVERDLGILESIHVNLVSVLYSKPSQGRQLADFLARCRHHNIFANVYVAGAYPLDLQPEAVKELLKAADLPNTPALFSYDLAWEPHLGKFERRKSLDARWNEWIDEQYGTAEAAVADWGYRPDATGSLLSGPTDEQLTQDGEHRAMVAAYRRFVDDIVSRGYGRVARLFRQLDPVHLLGARTGYGGTGQQWPVTSMAYDVASGAAHLDFLSPEAYGIDGDDSNFIAGGFTSEYCRLVSGGKPVFWSEFGMSVWPRPFDPKTLGAQGALYQKSYDLLFARSHAAGSAAWWYPGGYRVQEASDYGIVDQDGALRPAAHAIHESAHRMGAHAQLPEVSETVLIDRDLHVNGYAGVWKAARDRYVELALQNRRLTPVTGGTGTTSADCPAVAVGNTPWTGPNPSKYLNGEITRVQIRTEGSEWQDVEGDNLLLEQGKQTELRALLTNSGESRWLAGEGETGSVCLQLDGASNEHACLEADVDALAGGYSLPVTVQLPTSGAAKISLRLNCSDRGQFGQRLTLELSHK